MTELGQLDPDWFQVLTTRASSKEGNLSDSDDQEELCPNQEANFKTPLRKTAAADVAQSQHSSIPRVFRRSYVPSPDNDDRQGVENCISDLKPFKWCDQVRSPTIMIGASSRQDSENRGLYFHSCGSNSSHQIALCSTNNNLNLCIQQHCRSAYSLDFYLFIYLLSVQNVHHFFLLENEPLPWGTTSPCLFGLAKDA